MSDCKCITAMARYRCRHAYGLHECELNDNTMQRSTVTSLEKLRKGDRFYFCSDKKKETWEMIEYKQGKSEVNKPTALNGVYMYRFPVLRLNTLPVVFLRHTVESINESDELKGIV